MACSYDTPSLEITGEAGGEVTANDTRTGLTSTSQLVPLKLDLCDDPAFSTTLDLVEKQAAAVFGQQPPPTKDAVGTDNFEYRAAVSAACIGPAPLTHAAELECWREAILRLNLKSTGFPCLSNFDAMVLPIAISRGNDLIVQHILSLPDIDINGRSPTGQSPLEAALKYQQYYIFQLLLSDPRTMFNHKNRLGHTPLHHAVEYGDLVAVQMLLAHGDIDINCLNAEGDNALLLAVANYDEHMPDVEPLSVIDRLLSTPGINVNQQDTDGRSALWHGVDFGIEKLVQSFTHVGHVDWNLPDHQGFTPLARAAENGNLRMVGLLLLQSGVHVNARSSQVVPPLWAACRAGRSSVVRLLLDHESININEKSPSGTSSLQVALTMHHPTIVHLLLNQTGELAVNDQGPQHWTALIFAAARGFSWAVNHLLELPNVDINTVDHLGRTALWWAAAGGHSQCVRSLVEQPRVDVAARDFQGKSAKDIAQDHDHWDIVGQLQAAAMWKYILWQ